MMLFLYLLCRYANRAKNIKNKAKINEDPKDALLREFQKEIEKLRAQLAEGTMNTLFLLSSSYLLHQQGVKGGLACLNCHIIE